MADKFFEYSIWFARIRQRRILDENGRNRGEIVEKSTNERRLVNQPGRFATRSKERRRRGRHSGTRRISALTRVSVRFADVHAPVCRTKGQWQVCVEIRSGYPAWKRSLLFWKRGQNGRLRCLAANVYDAGAPCSRWRLFTARWRWNSRRMLETQGMTFMFEKMVRVALNFFFRALC